MRPARHRSPAFRWLARALILPVLLSAAPLPSAWALSPATTEDLKRRGLRGTEHREELKETFVALNPELQKNPGDEAEDTQLGLPTLRVELSSRLIGPSGLVAVAKQQGRLAQMRAGVLKNPSEFRDEEQRQRVEQADGYMREAAKYADRGNKTLALADWHEQQRFLYIAEERNTPALAVDERGALIGYSGQTKVAGFAKHPILSVSLPLVAAEAFGNNGVGARHEFLAAWMRHERARQQGEGKLTYDGWQQDIHTLNAGYDRIQKYRASRGDQGVGLAAASTKSAPANQIVVTAATTLGALAAAQGVEPNKPHYVTIQRNKEGVPEFMTFMPEATVNPGDIVTFTVAAAPAKGNDTTVRSARPRSSGMTVRKDKSGRGVRGEDSSALLFEDGTPVELRTWVIVDKGRALQQKADPLVIAARQENGQYRIVQPSVVAGGISEEDTRTQGKESLTPHTPRALPLLIIGNWKTRYDDPADAKIAALKIAERFDQRVERGEVNADEVIPAVAASPVDLAVIAKALKGRRVKVTAQGVQWKKQPGEPKTNVVTIDQLKALGVQYVFIGHSEEGLADTEINRRLLLALEAGLTPIVFFGETRAQRDAGAGAWKQVVRQQLLRRLKDVPQGAALILSYEPTYAISKDDPKAPAAPTQDVEDGGYFGLQVALHEAGLRADRVRMGYGGSSKPDNAKALARIPWMSLLVPGTASQDPATFVDTIVAAAGGVAARPEPTPIEPLKAYATLDDVEVRGKTLLVRVDINGETMIDSDGKTHLKIDPQHPNRRFVGSAKTIKELMDKGAKVVVMFHQGRLGDLDHMELPDEHADELQRLIDQPIGRINDLFGERAVSAIRSLSAGQALVLKPVRAKDPSTGKTLEDNPFFVSLLEPHFDYFVLDGFSVAHRDSPSVTGFHLPVIAGRLMQQEIEGATNLRAVDIVEVGGSEIEEKLVELENALKNPAVRKVLVGGRLGNLALVAHQLNQSGGRSDYVALTTETLGDGTVGDLQRDFDKLPRVAQLLKEHGEKMMLPVDFAYLSGNEKWYVALETSSGRVPSGFTPLLNALGPQTARRFAAAITPESRVFSVGPLSDSRFPEFDEESRLIIEANQRGKFWASGGGDTDGWIARLGGTPSYSSTAGGALAEFRAGKALPGVKLLADHRPDANLPPVLRTNEEAQVVAHANVLAPILTAAGEAGDQLFVRTIVFGRGGKVDSVAINTNPLARAVRATLPERAHAAVAGFETVAVDVQNPHIDFSMSTIRTRDKRPINAAAVQEFLRANPQTILVLIPAEEGKKGKPGAPGAIDTQKLHTRLHTLLLEALRKRGINPDAAARVSGPLPTMVQVGSSNISGELKVATFVPGPKSAIGHLMQLAQDSGINVKTLIERAMAQPAGTAAGEALLGTPPAEPKARAAVRAAEPPHAAPLFPEALRSRFSKVRFNENDQTVYVLVEVADAISRANFDRLMRRAAAAQKLIRIVVPQRSPIESRLSEYRKSGSDSGLVTGSHTIWRDGKLWTAFTIQPAKRIVFNGFGNENIKLTAAFRAAGFTNVAVTINSLDRIERVIHAFKMGYDMYVTDRSPDALDTFAHQLRRLLRDSVAATERNRLLDGLPPSSRATAFGRIAREADKAAEAQVDTWFERQFKGALSVDALVDGQFDLVVDGAPDKVGAKNMEILYKPAMERNPHLKVVIQGGEGKSVAEASFNIITAVLEGIQPKRTVRHVSCNTTGLSTMVASFVDALGVPLLVDNTAIRRSVDPGDKKSVAISVGYDAGYHHWPDAQTVLSEDHLELVEANTDAAQASVTRFHVHVMSLRRQDGQKLDKQAAQEILAVQPRVALVDFTDGIFDTTALNELFHNLLQQRFTWLPEGASHSLMPIVTVQETDDPSELRLLYAVPQESIVAAGNVNAAQVLLGLVNSKDAALTIVNEAVGINALVSEIESSLPVHGLDQGALERAADRVRNLNEAPRPAPVRVAPTTPLGPLAAASEIGRVPATTGEATARPAAAPAVEAEAQARGRLREIAALAKILPHVTRTVDAAGNTRLQTAQERIEVLRSALADLQWATTQHASVETTATLAWLERELRPQLEGGTLPEYRAPPLALAEAIAHEDATFVAHPSDHTPSPLLDAATITAVDLVIQGHRGSIIGLDPSTQKTEIEPRKNAMDVRSKRTMEAAFTHAGIQAAVHVAEGLGRDEVPESFDAAERVNGRGLGPVYHVIVDVVEGTTATASNVDGKPRAQLSAAQSGGTTLLVGGAGVQSLPNAPDVYADHLVTRVDPPADVTAAIVKTAISHVIDTTETIVLAAEELTAHDRENLEEDFRQRREQLESFMVKLPSDRVAAVREFVQRVTDAYLNGEGELPVHVVLTAIATANGRSINDLEVVIMKRDREGQRVASLNTIRDRSAAGDAHMDITQIKDGTVAPGVLATIGQKPGRKHKLTWTVGGSAEAFANLAIAASVPGGTGVLDVYSKNVNFRTDGVSRATDLSRRHHFSTSETVKPGEKPEVKEIAETMGREAEKVLAGQRHFTPNDTHGGDVEAVIPIITDNGVFNLPGIREIAPGVFVSISSACAKVNRPFLCATSPEAMWRECWRKLRFKRSSRLRRIRP